MRKLRPGSPAMATCKPMVPRMPRICIRLADVVHRANLSGRAGATPWGRYDRACTASKAAQKMDELGCQQVYDYEAGKMDRKEAGLPVKQDSS